jgi:diaminopimelate decarboxylase
MSAPFWRSIPAELLERVSTPCMIYSAEQIRNNLALYESVIPQQRKELRYAIKACPLGPLLRQVAAAGWGADCQSRMEAEIALGCGLSASKLSLSSPRLSREDVRWCITSGIKINADSGSQLAMIGDVLLEVKPPPEWRFGVRLSLAVEETERFHSKLAVELETVVRCMRSMREETIALIDEVHHHGMAREVSPETSTRIAEELCAAVKELEGEFECCIERINLGGGLECDDLIRNGGSTTESIIANVCKIVSDAFGENERIIVLEPGRAIAKNAAVSVTSVVNLKQLKGKKIAVVDLSTNLLIPLPLAQFFVEPLDPVLAEDKSGGKVAVQTRHGWRSMFEYHVVDGTCSPAGVICRSATLPELKENDRLIVTHTGAYTWSLAEPFYDLLPDLWWIDQAHTLIFDRSKAKSVAAAIYSLEA